MAKSDPSLTKNQNGAHDLDDMDDLPEMHCDVCNLVFTAVSAYELHINGKRHNTKVRSRRLKKSMDTEKKSANVDQPKIEAEGDGSIPEAIYCALCKLHCSGFIPYKQHLKSSKHLRQLNKDQLNEHLQNTPEVLAEQKKNKEADVDDKELLGLPKSYGRCDICCKTFYAPEPLKQHMVSPGHAKKVSQANMKMNIHGTIANHADADVVINDEANPDADATNCFAECRTCSKRFSGPESFKMHLASSAHQKKIEMQKFEEEMKVKDDGPAVIEDGKYTCKECGKVFENFMALKQHLDSNIHAKINIKKVIADFLLQHPEITKLPPVAETGGEEEPSGQEMEDFYVCKLCKSSFSGPQCAKQHVMGRKHKKAKEIVKRLAAAPIPTTAKPEISSTTTEKPYDDNDDENSFEVIHQ